MSSLWSPRLSSGSPAFPAHGRATGAGCVIHPTAANDPVGMHCAHHCGTENSSQLGPEAPCDFKMSMGLDHYASDNESHEAVQSASSGHESEMDAEDGACLLDGGQIGLDCLLDGPECEDQVDPSDDDATSGAEIGELCSDPIDGACKGARLRCLWHGFSLNELHSTVKGQKTFLGLSIVCKRHQDPSDAEHHPCARSLLFASGETKLSEFDCEMALKRWLIKGFGMENDGHGRAKHMANDVKPRALLETPLTAEEKLAAINSGLFKEDDLSCEGL